VPAQTARLFRSGLTGRHGEVSADAGSEAGLAIGALNRDDPAPRVAVDFPGPWRALARAGEIYEERRVTDVRSRSRSDF
jgi:hypothetical protein